jgi:hypothetical protein
MFFEEEKNTKNYLCLVQKWVPPFFHLGFSIIPYPMSKVENGFAENYTKL